MKKSFAELWDAHPLHYKIGTNLLTAGLVALPAFGLWAGVSAGIMGLTSTLIATMAAVPLLLLKTGLKNSSLYKDLENMRRIASQEITEICDSLFKKANLPRYGHVYILDGDRSQLLSPEQRAIANSRIMVLETPDRTEIYIGKNNLHSLSREQLTAALAHETGHLMGHGSFLREIFTNVASRAPSAGLMAGCAMTGSFEALPLFGALHYACKFLNARIGRIEERRADRNGLGLYPRPAAFLTCLEQGLKEIRSHLKPTWLSKVRLFFFGNYPRDAVRFRAIEKNGDRAAHFYTRHGLTDDITMKSPMGAEVNYFHGTPCLKSHWHNEQPPANQNSLKIAPFEQDQKYKSERHYG